MRNKIFKILIVFTIILVLKIIGDHYSGSSFKGNLMPLNPQAWDQIRSNFISYVMFSSIITAIIFILLNGVGKKK